MSSIYLEDNLPIVKYEGLNTKKAVTINAALTATGAAILSSTLEVGTGITLDAGDISMVGNNAKIAWTGTGSNGGILSNPKNAAATTFTGTAKAMEISVGGTAYYIPLYATAA